MRRFLHIERATHAHRSELLIIGVAAVVSGVVLWAVMRISAGLMLADWSPHICRWDCSWYTYIVEEGYDRAPRAGAAGQANYAFFPAFPVLGWTMHKALGIEARDALVLTSRALYVVAALVFYACLLKRVGPKAALFGALLFLLSPYAIYGHAGYSEPLYFLLSTLSYWAVHERRWLAAGVIGALLSATRANGVLSAVVLATAGLRSLHRLTAEPKEADKFLLALALVPIGLAAFMLYLYDRTGDPLAFAHIQAAWSRRFSNPVLTLYDGLVSVDRKLYFAWVALAGLWMTSYLAARRYFEESVGLLVNILVPLSAGLAGMPRYVGWQFPFLFGIVVLVESSRPARRTVLVLSGFLAALMAFAWGSRFDFVI